ncbi:hypothetical protein BBJ28_00006522 [Nothophytophthora sp. Chile5]|nr:hypothetical protein BBJ28_00006522 [Nothophytophthora sp. Chile5]
MWVVDLGTFAIHMDDKPHRFLPPHNLKREYSEEEHDSASSFQNQIYHDNVRKPKRSRKAVDASTTCAPEQLLCRYANKKCLNPRAVKRTGGLHTFCAMHRANANRNQRRLDLRKRLQKQAMRAQSEGMQAPGTSPLRTTPKPIDVMSIRTPHAETDALYEPLATPTPLQEEDVSTLIMLFLPPSHVNEQPRADLTLGSQQDVSTPSGPNNWSSPTSTDNTPSPPPHGDVRY